MRDEELLESRCPPGPLDRGTQGITDGGITGGMQSHDLVDRDRTPRREEEAQHLGDPLRTGVGTAVLDGAAGGGEVGGHADTNPGCTGAAGQPGRVRRAAPGADIGQVHAVELAVPGHAAVGDRSVQGRLDRHDALPPVRGELGAQSCEMRVAHVHEAQLPHGQNTAVPHRVAHAPLQSARTQVQTLVMIEQRFAVRREPGSAVALRFDPEVQREPVGKVDHVLVVDLLAGHRGGEPVVAARGVRTGVVRITGRALGRGAAGGEVPVAQRAQGLAQAFRGRVVTVILPGPSRHG